MIPCHDKILTSAKAIEWAWEQCKVDIVSMSFGFSYEVVPINLAINKALSQRKGLFFAAASNKGANLKEMFPARHPNVISIRGTNADGHFPDFNPGLGWTQSIGFGTLGVEVPLNSDFEPRSGTSVATVVAAAYAALLLCYARGRIQETSYKTVTERLLEKGHMELLFYALSQESMQKGLWHLKPWDGLQSTSDQDRWAKLVEATSDN